MNSSAQAAWNRGVRLCCEYAGRLQGKESDESACRRRTRCSAWRGGSKRAVCFRAEAASPEPRQWPRDPLQTSREVSVLAERRSADRKATRIECGLGGFIFGFKRLGSDFPIGFFQQNFHAAFGFFEIASGTRARVSRPPRKDSWLRREKGRRFRAA